MARPGYYRFECKQYEDPFVAILVLEQEDGSMFDATGCTGLLQIRTLDDVLVATVETTFPTTSTMRIELGAAQATVWPLPAKRYLYDLPLELAGSIGFWLEGDWIIHKTVSRT